MRLRPSTIPPLRKYDLRGALTVAERFTIWLTASSQRTLAFALVLSILFGGFYALRLGQDTNVDQRNYHFESAYEFLSGRIDVDAAPSGLLHSYFNPLPYVPFYEMARHWRPSAAIFVLGAWHGVNFALAFALVYRLSAARNLPRPALLAALGAILAGAGAMTLSEVGSSNSDLLLSPLILLAVWLLVESAEARRAATALKLAALASMLVGLAVGLKLTNSIYAFGLALACLVGWRTWSLRAASLAVCGLAGAVGVAISGGFWFVTLWRRFQNPLFPYYDSYFHSPAIDSASFLHGLSYFDTRFLPTSLTSALTYPFQWMATGHTTSELLFRDMRFGALFAILIVGAALYLARRVRSGGAGEAMILRAGEARVLAFFFAAYVVWLAQFGIQRYIVALELLLGPCLFIALTFVVAEKWLPVALAGLALGGAATTLPPNWGHVQPKRDWYAVTLPPALQNPAIVLAVPASSYLFPFLPPDSVVFSFNWALPPRPGGDGLVDRAFDAALARKPEMPIVLLVPQELKMEERKQLGRLGLGFEAPCQSVANAASFVAACPLARGIVGPVAAPTLEPAKTLGFGATGEGVAALRSGWNADSSWGNVAPGISPKLIFKGSDEFGEEPVRMTFQLAGIGDLGATDDLGLRVGAEIVAAWPFKGIASQLTACVPARLLPPDAATEIAFVDLQHGETAPPHRLGSMGLASLNVQKGGCKTETVSP